MTEEYDEDSNFDGLKTDLNQSCEEQILDVLVKNIFFVLKLICNWQSIVIP